MGIMTDEVICRRRVESNQAWSTFSCGHLVEENQIDETIRQSWLRSRAYDIPSGSPTLPDVSSQEKAAVTTKYTEYVVYLHDRFSMYYQLLEELLSELGGAVFYVNEELCVFHKGGDETLIKELKRNNVKYGSNFREETAGTNAVFLSQLTGEPTWTIGHEHYCDVLKNYAMCALQPIYSILFGGCSMLLIFPLERISQATVKTSDFLLHSFYSIYNYASLLEFKSHNEIIKAALGRSNSFYVLCNVNGRVVEASDAFFERFELTPRHTAGELIDNAIDCTPALSNHIQSKKKMTLKSVIIRTSRDIAEKYIIECSPIYNNNNEQAGTLFILTETKEITNYLKNLSGSDPYYTFDRIIGISQSFQNAINVAISSASSKSNILIQGESGTGKELFAQAIHNQAFPQMNRPFIAVNCGSFPKELLNSELFGYVEGAFTGARKDGAPGKFELADGGTLFLDEISEMPLEMQTVLLRALEEQSITRLGSSKSVPIDVRIISATNKNLWQMVQSGDFRLDLYYRLNVIPVNIPPLRERTEDIPLLVNHFISEFSGTLHKQIKGASPDFMDELIQHSWPGNVRELRNLIERSISLSKENILSDWGQFSDLNGNRPKAAPKSEVTKYEEYELQLITSLMIKHRGNKSTVAKEIGVSRKTLYNKLNKYGLIN